ncbi:MAG: TIM barrel protein [Clostridia bacterium]|nr:TIM barrel protein [Clostridia bacterium]
MSVAKFGPGGGCEEFRLSGAKSVLDAPAFVKGYGLDAYEYEAGNGLSASAESLLLIGQEAKRQGIAMSLHAPYFISLSSVEAIKRLNSVEYIRRSLSAARLLGASVIVVHTGSAAKITRREAMDFARDTLYKTLESVDTYGVLIGLETMGKQNQLGTLDEVIELCSMDKRLVPVVDFGHMNARECGGVFASMDDYRRVFDVIGDRLGDAVAQDLHCHFSKIEWTAAGEKRHLTFDDSVFGPDFEPLAEAIVREGLSPTVICESAGTQTRDARRMKDAYERSMK